MLRSHEVTVEELIASTSDPFVRHQIDPSTASGAWVRGEAVVVSGGRGRPGETPLGPVYTCLGPVADLAPLMRQVAATEAPAWRVTSVSEADGHVPASWHRPVVNRWHWMVTQTAPPEITGVEVEQIRDAGEIHAVLDAANADSHARPGTPGIEAWLGTRDDSVLLAVGALMRLHDGTGHLRGVSVLPRARGRGLGTAISAALTRRGFASGSSVCTLGVYTHNATAVSLYRRLGYRVVHTFASGAVDPNPA